MADNAVLTVQPIVSADEFTFLTEQGVSAEDHTPGLAAAAPVSANGDGGFAAGSSTSPADGSDHGGSGRLISTLPGVHLTEVSVAPADIQSAAPGLPDAGLSGPAHWASGTSGNLGAGNLGPLAGPVDSNNNGYFLLSHNAGHVSAPYSGNQDIDAVLFGSWWNAPGGVISFSFPTAANQYQSGYGSQTPIGGDFASNPGGFVAFNGTQQLAAYYALGLISSFTGLSFVQSVETTTIHATLRFAQTNDSSLTSAHAWFPSGMNQSGDVWLGTGTSPYGPQPYYTTPHPGNWGQATIMHELGHAMGLKHGHSNDTYYDTRNYLWPADPTANYGSGPLPSNHDGQSWSLMTYRSDPGNSTQFEGDGYNQPQTYMQDDIAALQYLYGANYSYNSGNTTYTFSTTTGQMFINGAGQGAPTANIIYRTVWDGGGTDTYDLSNYSTSLLLDLRPGSFSNFGMQLANNRAYSGGVNYAPGNVANALLHNGNTASLIENAIGGSGNDIFIGNAANNHFWGNAGNDTVYFDGNQSGFSFTEGDNWSYTVYHSGQGTDALTSIETFHFDDTGYVYDDIMGGLSTSAHVGVGGAATGQMQFYGDRDWFGVTLQAGHSYLVVEQGSPSGNGTLDDTYLYFYDHTGTQVAYNDDGGLGFESQLGVHVTSGSGTFFIGAGAYFNHAGSYTVSIQDLGTASTTFASLGLELGAFGANPSAGGWASQDHTPRTLGHFNGDDGADIFGFANAGVYVATSTGTGFDHPTLVLNAFGASASAGGWSSFDKYPRFTAHVDNPSYSDIVGFAGAGVYVADNNFDGTFDAPHLALAKFGANASAGGWASQDHTPRMLGDLNGDAYDDIIGFANAGVYVAINNHDGTFQAPHLALAKFGASAAAGGWSSQDSVPRMVADVNGDGYGDIVGFAHAGIYVAQGNGDGTFDAPHMAFAGFNSAGGWNSQDVYPRQLADVNGDGRADVVGFGVSRVYYALGQSDGTFGSLVSDVQAFGRSAGAGGWASFDKYPRMLADVTGDGHDDIVAFAGSGVHVGQSFDFALV